MTSGDPSFCIGEVGRRVDYFTLLFGLLIKFNDDGHFWLTGYRYMAYKNHVAGCIIYGQLIALVIIVTGPIKVLTNHFIFTLYSD